MKKNTPKTQAKTTKKTPAKPCKKATDEITMDIDQVMTFHVLGKDKKPMADMNFLVDKNMPHGKFREGLMKAVETAVGNFLTKWFVTQVKDKNPQKKTVSKKKTKK